MMTRTHTQHTRDTHYCHTHTDTHTHTLTHTLTLSITVSDDYPDTNIKASNLGQCPSFKTENVQLVYWG